MITRTIQVIEQRVSHTEDRIANVIKVYAIFFCFVYLSPSSDITFRNRLSQEQEEMRGFGPLEPENPPYDDAE